MAVVNKSERGAVVVPRSTIHVEHRGELVTLTPDTRLRASHPIVKSNPDAFVPAPDGVDFEG